MTEGRNGRGNTQHSHESRETRERRQERIRRKKRKQRIRYAELFTVLAVMLVCVVLLGKTAVKQIRKNKDNAGGSSSKVSKNVKNQETTEIIPTTEEPTTEEPTTEPPKPAIDPDKPMIALTFDDGPNPKTTPRLLDALEAHNAHATFFIVGYSIDGNEDLIKREYDIGCEPANHTMNHSQLTKLDGASIESEIAGVESRIKEITGQERVILRPPYGAINDDVMSHIHTPVILWSVDTLDWKNRNVEMNIQSIKENVYDGAIILMHDIHAESVDAAIQVLDWLQEQGYQLVTVSELGEYRDGGLKEGIRYGSLKPEPPTEPASEESGKPENGEEETTQKPAE